MTAHDREDIASYAAAVGAALADLGGEERAPLLADLEARLREVASESGVSPAERLGPPEAYAAELRAAHGAPPRGRRRPAGRRRRRLAVLVLVPLLVAGVAAVVAWQVGRSSGAHAGAQWSYERLRSEAAAGHVSQVVIRDRGWTATDSGGVEHAVSPPGGAEAAASELTGDGVDVVYQAQPGGVPFHALSIVALLLVVLPIVLGLVVAVLLIGVLWRLYRSLGPPAA